MRNVKKSWIVTMRRTVKTSFVVEGISEDQAWNDPYSGDVSDETELDQSDYKVLTVEPNK